MTEKIDLPDGTYTAVVDAIEDGQARMFVELGDDELTSVILSGDRLPEDGRHADAVFTIIIEDGGIGEMEYDPDATDARRERAQSRFDRLSRRLSDDSEKRQ